MGLPGLHLLLHIIAPCWIISTQFGLAIIDPLEYTVDIWLTRLVDVTQMIDRHQILDALRVDRARGVIRRRGSFGRRGVLDALRDLLPPPSACARRRFSIRKKWDWIDWVQHSTQTTAPLAQLRIADLALRDAVHKSDLGKRRLAESTRNELSDVAAVFYGAAEIASPRRTRSEIGAGLGICALCADWLDGPRSARACYCEQHDPLLSPAAYRSALRRADAVIEHLVAAGQMEINPDRDRLNTLWAMWRALSERVGQSSWSVLRTEFDRLAPVARAERGAQIRHKISDLLARGLSQAEAARQLGISRQRVNVLLRG
ncbi:MAG: hypothetical protein ACYCVY_12050 [Acidiferrobacteraceae bacterium]